ncbi:ExbD/TolR family protein [Alkalimarinus sediminis]|uniref:Biopolymer transporter ExbD n=1 Tax=Alkalimarinus sediminis TaxID=1632866 RepID=A0A9E8KR75_9ALTE|nr:biopolymer transporter ExbD [Alkalimarinus sediminis]UZW76010.1 biopolymer transporter ExbD [Alkalimarinus sediminis]
MRRKHRKLHVEAELDITAFMNLMIVLVPVLLLSMVFAHTSILELNFPAGPSESDLNDENFQLQVVIRPNALVVADSKGGLIKRIDNQDTQYQFAELRELLKQLKARIPDKKDISLLAEKDTSYQTLVTAMDTVRSYPAVVAASVVEAELFPDISIGDAPELSAISGQSTLSDQQGEIGSNSNSKSGSAGGAQ